MRPAELPAEVFRLGRRPDPWAWPDWRYAAADGTFGNRFDDPHGQFRVLYASTRRLATFVECLAYSVPTPPSSPSTPRSSGSEGDDEPPIAGAVPAEWIDARCVGTATRAGDYVDIGHHETIAELRYALSVRVVHHGVPDLDAAAIRLTVPRGFTRDLARHVFDQTIGGNASLERARLPLQTRRRPPELGDLRTRPTDPNWRHEHRRSRS